MGTIIARYASNLCPFGTKGQLRGRNLYLGAAMKCSTFTRKAWFLSAAAGAMMMAASVSAHASIISVTPTGGSVGDNVLSANCADGANGPAMTITGCLNGDRTSTGDVDFRSNENIQFDAGGQAVVTDTNQDGFNTLTVDPRVFSLGELIVDIDANANGWVQFCDNTGCYGTLFQISKSGSNFFDIKFNPNADWLQMNTFTSSSATTAAKIIANTKQWRLSDVPEPLTVSLFSAGLLGAFALARRRTAKMAPRLIS